MPEFKSSLIMPGQAPDEATASCWSCGTMRAVHFCSACGKVQPPVPVDYFTFFGFPRKLNLDTAALEKEFYALSRRLHPDGFGQADPNTCCDWKASNWKNSRNRRRKKLAPPGN